MPSNSVYAFSYVDNVRSLRVNTNRYEMRKDMGWLWLQAVCFWVLGKIGAFAQETVFKAKTIEVQCKSLMEMAYKQRNVVGRMHTKHPTHIVIGCSAWEEIGCDQMKNGYSFGPIASPFGGTMLGMRAIYVPWFDGVLILPPDAIEDAKNA